MSKTISESCVALLGTEDRARGIEMKTSKPQIRAIAGGSSELEISADECKKLCKACNSLEYLSGYETRVRAFTVSDGTVDRYGDIVQAKGAAFDNYKRNPVVQFGHDYSMPPIGNSLRTWYDKESNTVRSWALFFDDRVDSSGRSDLIYRYIAANALRACSVGFQPIEWVDPEEEERKKLGLGKWGVLYTKWDMLEFSPVPVPANPNALTDEYATEFRKGLITSLRDGRFVAKDVGVLRRYPLFEETVLDEFIKELGGNMVGASGTQAPISQASPREPEKGVTLDMANAILNMNDLLVATKKSIDTLNVTISAQKNEPDNGAQQGESVDLYDCLRLTA